ncbi:MAG TPA: hypothetical protein VIY27_02580 [Myxococcota bacterium]
MTYHRPYPWTPMYPNVPMLGQAVTAEEAMLTAAAVDELQRPSSSRGMSTGNILAIGAVVILGIVVAGWAAAPELAARRRRRVTPNRRRSRTSKKKSSRRTSRNALTKRQRAAIPKRLFVFPKRRAWPLNTKRRARAAISYMHMGRVKSAADFNKIRNKVRCLWPDVWDEYGRGKVSWEKVKRAKAKRARSRRRRPSRRRRAA